MFGFKHQLRHRIDFSNRIYLRTYFIIKIHESLIMYVSIVEVLFHYSLKRFFSTFNVRVSLNSITKMASSAAPVDNAVVAVAYSTFESLRLGRTVHAVVGRLIRFSDSRKINKNGDFMGITILLLDELVRIISNLFLLFFYLKL